MTQATCLPYPKVNLFYPNYISETVLNKENDFIVFSNENENLEQNKTISPAFEKEEHLVSK